MYFLFKKNRYDIAQGVTIDPLSKQMETRNKRFFVEMVLHVVPLICFNLILILINLIISGTALFVQT